MTSLTRLLSYLPLATVLLVGCRSTTTVPTSDSTPPEVVLYYHTEGESWEELKAPDDWSKEMEYLGKSVEIGANESIYLCAEAEDPEGIFLMTLKINGALIYCTGSVDGASSPNIPPDITTTSDAFEPGDTADTKKRIVTSIPIPSLCTSGNPSGNLTISATADNFHGGTSTSPALGVTWH